MSAGANTNSAAMGPQDQSPPAAKDWRAACDTRIMICLAGRAAEARARRPDHNGWCRRMDERERVSWHEAGHITAAAVSTFQNGAAIEMVGHRYRGIAAHSDVALPEGPDHPSFDNFDLLPRDFVKATAYAQLVVGQRGWLAYLRGLWHRTDALLGENWLCVKMLSLELQRTGCVRRDRAQQIIDRWCGVPEASLVEALKREQRGA